MARIIQYLSEISDSYDVLLCDLWGCFHEGVMVFPGAVEALRQFRASGGKVIMLTNSPRLRVNVEAQLRSMGATEAVWDDIISSGDLTRNYLEAHRQGQRCFFIGPERDLPIIAGLDIQMLSIENIEDSDFILCSGFFDDENDIVDDYGPLLQKALAKELPMIVANPDSAVSRGKQTILCAGILSHLYQQMGGKTRYFGKPHAPIYLSARTKAAKMTGKDQESVRMLAIGDGLETDIFGAARNSIDTVFVSSGLHKDKVGIDPAAPDSESLDKLFIEYRLTPLATIGHLQ